MCIRDRAYIYLPDTALGGLTNFNRYYFAQLDKQGAVIDERFNSGGQAADYIIHAMQRTLMSWWAPVSYTHLLAGLFAGQPIVDGPHDLDGIRSGRRDCGDRKHHASPGSGYEALAGRAARLARDRLHRDLDEYVAGRGLHTDSHDGGYRRTIIPGIRQDVYKRQVLRGSDTGA